MYVYLDESGCMGFVQRSTRYFTIAFVVVRDPAPFRRCIKRIKIRHNIPINVELKGASTKREIKEDLLRELLKIDMEIHAITVYKENVYQRLRGDTNILYNYMVGLSLVERVLQEPMNMNIIIQVDKRITSITSGFSLDDYLKLKILYEAGRYGLNLHIHHLDSLQSYAIQGTDIICNTIFRKYNSRDFTLFNIIQSKVMGDRKLFLNK